MRRGWEGLGDFGFILIDVFDFFPHLDLLAGGKPADFRGVPLLCVFEVGMQ